MSDVHIVAFERGTITKKALIPLITVAFVLLSCAWAGADLLSPNGWTTAVSHEPVDEYAPTPIYEPPVQNTTFSVSGSLDSGVLQSGAWQTISIAPGDYYITFGFDYTQLPNTFYQTFDPDWAPEQMCSFGIVGACLYADGQTRPCAAVSSPWEGTNPSGWWNVSVSGFQYCTWAGHISSSLTLTIRGFVETVDENGGGAYSASNPFINIQPVPEPSSILALLCGLGGLGAALLRRRM